MNVVRDIALVISDIDGTLITSNHEVTEATKRTAHALIANGIKLALASSRPPRAIRPIATSLELEAPFAAFNGGLIAQSDGSTVVEGKIEPWVTLAVRSIANGLGLDVWLYDACDWWASERTPFVEREEHTARFNAQLEDYEERLTYPLNKLTVVGMPDRVALAEGMILRDLASEVSVSSSKPRFLDVTAYGCHKGNVVSRFSSIFECPSERIAVIGDGPNDVEMFSRAGISIAMGQAVEKVRSHALFITNSNDEEGWARGIERFVLSTAS